MIAITLTLVGLAIAFFLLAIMLSRPLQTRLGLARDWRVIASKPRVMTERTGDTIYGVEYNVRVKDVTHVLVLERCSLTGRERARLIRPPHSAFSTTSYDLSLARIELGVSDKAPSP